MSRGRRGLAAWLADLRRAVRVLNDPIALEDTAFANVPAIRRKAEEQFRGRTCALGHAVAATLRAGLVDVSEDLPNSAVGTLAAGLAAGKKQSEIAECLGITQEHLTRRHKRVLLQLLYRKLQAAGATRETLILDERSVVIPRAPN